jgi:hypothetical protein
MVHRFVPVLLLSLSVAQAHLDSLFSPTGGAAYPAGGTLLVQWTIGNNHNGIDVYLSTDDRTWTVLSADMPRTAMKYLWTITAQPTDRARIRVCQKSGPEGCTDADSLSNPTDGPLYVLVSGRFRIESAPAGIAPVSAESPERLLLPGVSGCGWTRTGSLPRDLRGRALDHPRPVGGR